jgi:murein DD-endopeptidase MepM/ murein hydrolase activator NlpD/cell division protein FtsB
LDIIIVSGKKNKTLNFRVKSVFFIFSLFVVVIIVFLFAYNVINFTTSKVDKSKYGQLGKENEIIQQEIMRLKNEISNLSGLIDTLEIYDEEIRRYAPLTPIDEAIRSMGIGGYILDSTFVNLSIEDSKELSNVSQILDNLLARAKLQRRSFDDILRYLEEKRYLRDHTPSIIPVQGWLIRGFGYHIDPFTGKVKMHEGIDVAAPIGTQIIAPADGVVRSSSVKKGFGLTLEIDHGYGFRTLYAHCQRIRVNPGMTIRRGDIIAYVGNTGKSTGPHLHYEVHVSHIPVNPVNYVLTSSTIVD